MREIKSFATRISQAHEELIICFIDRPPHERIRTSSMVYKKEKKRKKKSVQHSMFQYKGTKLGERKTVIVKTTPSFII